jgi:DNA-binding NarL/FixJ family response regulator
LIADDHAVVLEGLRRILNRPECEVVGAVTDGHALVEAAINLCPGVIIADVSMPSLNGIEAARQICKLKPKSKIIFLTMHPEAIFAVQAMSGGASGYVLKNAAGEELITAIRDVLDGFRREIHAWRRLPSTSSRRVRRRNRRRHNESLIRARRVPRINLRPAYL